MSASTTLAWVEATASRKSSTQLVRWLGAPSKSKWAHGAPAIPRNYIRIQRKYSMSLAGGQVALTLPKQSKVRGDGFATTPTVIQIEDRGGVRRGTERLGHSRRAQRWSAPDLLS